MAESENFTVEDARLYGEKAVELALEHALTKLDFSVESLFLVDDLLEFWHEEGHSCEDMPATVYLFGCYLGEVIIRNHGGVWRDSADTPYAETSAFPVMLELPNGGICNPLGKVCKLLDYGRGESVRFFYDGITALR